jgi:predicted secreted protein
LEQRRITLKKGQSRTFKLGGLGAAGYIWKPTTEGPIDIVTIESKPTEATPSSTPKDATPTTSSINEIFAIQALRPGKTKVKLQLHRPWEKDKPPLREIILEIRVSE